MAPQKPVLQIPFAGSLSPHAALQCLEGSLPRTQSAKDPSTRLPLVSPSSPALSPLDRPYPSSCTAGTASSKLPHPYPHPYPSSCTAGAASTKIPYPHPYPSSCSSGATSSVTTPAGALAPFCEWAEWRSIQEEQPEGQAPAAWGQQRLTHRHSESEARPSPKDQREQREQQDLRGGGAVSTRTICGGRGSEQQQQQGQSWSFTSNSSVQSAHSATSLPGGFEPWASPRKPPPSPSRSATHPPESPAEGTREHGSPSPAGASPPLVLVEAQCINFQEVGMECKERQLDRDTLEGVSIYSVPGAISADESEGVLYALYFSSDPDTPVLCGDESVRQLFPKPLTQSVSCKAGTPKDIASSPSSASSTASRPGRAATALSSRPLLATFAEWQALS